MEAVMEQTSTIWSYSAFIQYCSNLSTESRFYFEQLRRYVESATSSRHGDILALDLGQAPSSELPHLVPFETSQSSPRLLILGGFPSPESIVELGDRYRLRPEFFLGHLENERILIHEKTSYELPALPSRQENIIHVRLVRLGRAVNLEDSIQPQSLPNCRITADSDCEKYEKGLFDDRRYRATRFRKVNLHTSRYFSVEQLVSFSVVTESSGGWTGVFLLDRGLNVTGGHKLPWDAYSPRPSQPPTFLPTVQYNEPDKQDKVIDLSTLHPTLKLDHTGYMLHPYHPMQECLSTTQCDLLRQDPFFVLSRLYCTASLSWAQMLNFLDEDVNRCQEASSETSSYATRQIRYNISLIQRFQPFILNDYNIIKQYGSASWPRISATSKLKPELDRIQENLCKDYMSLLNQCKSLTQRCEVTSGILMSSISILEAQRSIDQSIEVAKLTKLAFVFVPLSFVASVFGMNVKEISAHNPSLWVFFLVSLVVGAVSYAILKWSSRSHRVPVPGGEREHLK